MPGGDFVSGSLLSGAFGSCSRIGGCSQLDLESLVPTVLRGNAVLDAPASVCLARSDDAERVNVWKSFGKCSQFTQNPVGFVLSGAFERGWPLFYSYRLSHIFLLSKGNGVLRSLPKRGSSTLLTLQRGAGGGESSPTPHRGPPGPPSISPFKWGRSDATVLGHHPKGQNRPDPCQSFLPQRENSAA